jgi:hypothetical protein
VLWLAALGQEDEHVIRIAVGPEGCTWGAPLECSAPRAILVGSVLTMACILVYAALYVSYTWRTWRALRGVLYQRFRIWNMIWQLQVRVAVPL